MPQRHRAPALQRTQLQLAANARLEWLPLEAIVYPGCLAENRLTMDLAPGAELIGWDVTAFGLPAANLPFDAPATSSALPTGQFTQHIELSGVWLERARIRDALLLDSPLELAVHRCMATLFLATGTSLGRARRQLALDTARDVLAAHPLHATAGATSRDGQVVVVWMLAPMVEPALSLLKQVRNA